MANKKLTCVSYVMIDDKKPVLLSSLSDEEKEQLNKVWCERIGKALSLYYTQYPEEYSKV